MCVIFSLIGFFSDYVVYAQNDSSCDLAELSKRVSSINIAMEAFRYDLAINESQELLYQSEIQDCDTYKFFGYNLLSKNFLRLRDSAKALEYSEIALEIAQSTENDSLIAIAYDGLAATLDNSPDAQRKALELHLKTLQIHKELHPEKFLKPALEVATIYKDLGEYTKMMQYIEVAQESLNNKNAETDIPQVSIDILKGDYYSVLGNLDSTIVYYDSAFNRIEKSSMPQLALSFYDRYAEFLYEIGNPAQAYKVQTAYNDYLQDVKDMAQRESVLLAVAKSDAEEYKRQRNEANIEAEVAKADLKRQEREDVLLWILCIMGGVFILYFYLSMRARKRYIRKLKLNNKELTKAKSLLEESATTKARFFSTLSHEMRTPLYSVTGIAGLLEKDKKFLKRYNQEISSLKFSTNHLLDIINDLLDITKLDDKSFKLNIRPFNLKILMGEILSSFDKYAYKGNTELTLHIDEDLPNYLLGDSRRLSQIIINILSNALKFTNDGNIWVRLDGKRLENGKYTINFSIQDTGIGIDEKAQKSIFDEFSQVEERKNKSGIGTGLGLAIVKKLLNKMDSTIKVKSKVGDGSTFYFSIDFKEATLQDVINYEEPHSLEKNSASEKLIKNASILIVDDNKINRLVTSKILKGLDANVSEAKSGEDTLELLKKQSFDLILMDVHMPGMDGFETTAAIRTFDTYIPVIALTATNLGEITEKMEESGMNGYIVKPYSMHEFVNTIVSHLHKANKPLSI